MAGKGLSLHSSRHSHLRKKSSPYPRLTRPVQVEVSADGKWLWSEGSGGVTLTTNWSLIAWCTLTFPIQLNFSVWLTLNFSV